MTGVGTTCATVAARRTHDDVSCVRAELFLRERLQRSVGGGLTAVRFADGATFLGTPAMPNREFLRMTAVQMKLPELQKQLKDLEKRLAALEKDKTP